MGVNRFQAREKESVPIHANDPELESEQIERLNVQRAQRDGQAVAESLRNLEHAARTNENLLPHIVSAVDAYASVGEISDVFRRVHGEYREAPGS